MHVKNFFLKKYSKKLSLCNSKKDHFLSLHVFILDLPVYFGSFCDHLGSFFGLFLNLSSGITTWPKFGLTLKGVLTHIFDFWWLRRGENGKDNSDPTYNIL